MQIAQERICTSTLHLIQALAQQSTSAPPLLLVTWGAQMVGSHDLPLSSIQAALWGLGRVIQNEHPELHCKLLDLSPQQEAFDMATFVQELLEQEQQDEQAALRAAHRYGTRLTPLQPGPERSQPQEKRQLIVGPDHPFSLEMGTPGILDSLYLRECPRPAPDLARSNSRSLQPQ